MARPPPPQDLEGWSLPAITSPALPVHMEAVCLSSHPCLGTRRPTLFSSTHPRGTVLSLLPRLCKALAIWKTICWWDLGLSSLYFDHFLYLSRHPVLYLQGAAWSFRQQEKSLALTGHGFLKGQVSHDIE